MGTRRTPYPVCRSCGQTFAGRTDRPYCGSACQHEHHRQLLTARWLETGEWAAHSDADNFVRRYLRDQQGDRCAVCELPPEWMGKPLAFVLDHVNGNALDQRRENLRLICPNCDSQTSTYRGRNLGSGRGARLGHRVGGAVRKSEQMAD